MAHTHTSLRNRRSVWERLSPDYRQDDPTDDGSYRQLGDSAKLPADVRQEARAAAADHGVPIHVFQLKSGEYRGVTANDTRGLARYEKIATKVATVRPPRKSAAEQASKNRIPNDVLRDAKIGARKHGKAIVVFRLKSGDYRGVTEDDHTTLARYRKSAVELGTIPIPARLPMESEDDEEEPEPERKPELPPPIPEPVIPAPRRPRGRPRKLKPEMPETHPIVPHKESIQPAEERMEPQEPEASEPSVQEPAPLPIAPPIDQEKNDLDEARTRMNKLEELLKNAIQ